MTTKAHAAIQFYKENRDQNLKQLDAFLEIPSISTDSTRRPEVVRAAEWLAADLRDMGAGHVALYPTSLGHPVVYGDFLQAGPAAPTVLLYGHYDVQPTDPLDKWVSPPFEPTIRGDYLYARGTSDMKGQVMASLFAVEAVLRTTGLPVNIKFLFEGQEEIGSRELETFITSNQDLLACDFSLNPDAGMLGANLPTLTYALRGLMDCELRFFGPTIDQHSGLYGGTIHNPAQALCEIVAGMHDEHGRVTLPGFYDSVRPISAEERAELSRLPMDETYFRTQTGVDVLWGEPDYPPVERIGARPTLEVNGLLSGWTGEGMKTVLPAMAMAKLSTRLVPDQDPKEVVNQLKAYLESHVPPTIRWELEVFSGNPASISDRDSSEVKAMSDALETVWGTRPLFRRVGGTIPVVGMVQRILGVESVLTGFGLPEDNVHSPNERIHLPTWEKGIEALIHFFYNLH